jgi:hypothetical protein
MFPWIFFNNMTIPVINTILLFSGFSFFFFGMGCWINPHLKREFIRYGIPQFRIVTGLLQLLGALGIGMGFWFLPLQIFSTAGLSLLMFFGLCVRIKIKDSFFQSFPALFYCLLNAYLTFHLLQ